MTNIDDYRDLTVSASTMAATPADMTKTTALLLCKCGCHAEFGAIGNAESVRWFACCPRCGAETPPSEAAPTKEEAATIWNSRSTPADLSASPAPAVAVPRGWKLVPIIPSTDMAIIGGDLIEAGGSDLCSEDVYAAMLKAAPPAPSSSPTTPEQSAAFHRFGVRLGWWDEAGKLSDKVQAPGYWTREQQGEALTVDELRALQNDPRYWRDRDPGMVAQVEAGWKRLHGSPVEVLTEERDLSKALTTCVTCQGFGSRAHPDDPHPLPCCDCDGTGTVSATPPAGEGREALIKAAAAVLHEYDHPATGDGYLFRKMQALRAALAAARKE